MTIAGSNVEVALRNAFVRCRNDGHHVLVCQQSPLGLACGPACVTKRSDSVRVRRVGRYRILSPYLLHLFETVNLEPSLRSLGKGFFGNLICLDDGGQRWALWFYTYQGLDLCRSAYNCLQLCLIEHHLHDICAQGVIHGDRGGTLTVAGLLCNDPLGTILHKQRQHFHGCSLRSTLDLRNQAQLLQARCKVRHSRVDFVVGLKLVGTHLPTRLCLTPPHARCIAP
mmetsp:Transcript_87655/g.145639  ORF Transcript_87655/g.145639 Transcript_87655/m.145639 type:complete len:226 (-) Transcript_87655:277-954(-)